MAGFTRDRRDQPLAQADATGERRHPAVRSAAVAVAYLLGYVLLDWVSYIDPIYPLGITPWNPPPGLSLFLLLHSGIRYAPWLFVATLLAEVTVRGLPAPLPVLIIAGAVLAGGYTAVAALLQRRVAWSGRLAGLRDVAVFTMVVVPATALISIAYVTVFAVSGVLPAESYARSVGQFWIGDLIGIVVTTPLLLVAARAPGRRIGISADRVVAAVLLVVVLWIVFGRSFDQAPRLFYVLFLPVMLIAMRHGLAGTAWATLVVQVALIVALRVAGFRPGEVLDFQLLMLTLAFTGLFLGATVDERRAAEARLRDKQFELDRSLRLAATSELASALAHELNQPLSAIGTYAQACSAMLEEGRTPRETLVATVRKINAETARAGAVLQRLREFFRSGTVNAQVIGVRDLLEGVCDAARLRAQRHEVRMSIVVPADVPPVWADRVQVETVLHNLIGNALDALKTSAAVPRTLTISARSEGAAEVRIRVADNGPGLAHEIRATLFAPFATTKSEGTGLGLAISRSIIEAQGGRLELEASAVGAVFSFTLPTANTANRLSLSE